MTLDLAPAPEPEPAPPTSSSSPGRVDVGGVSDVGRLRSANEDAFMIATLHRAVEVEDASPGARGWFQGESAGTLLIVADGMGGHGGGEVASATAVKAVTEHLLNVMPWVRAKRVDAPQRVSTMGVRGALSTAILAGDEDLKSQAAHTRTPQMGTTLTMAFVLGSFVYLAHVGDTRCYLFQSGVLRCLTRDHNMAQRFVEMSTTPVEPPEQLQHLLWNALGAGIEQPIPDITKLEVEAGAVLLLCSDGLNKHVSDETIASVLGGNEPCKRRAQRLVNLANAGGGTDNTTAIVADISHSAGTAGAG